MTLIVRTLSNQLVDLVRDRILSGQAPPDSPIRQDALANEFGVSKIPLREALARLEQEGLIVAQANRGFFVTPMAAAEAEEVYALRLKLEPDEAARAAECATAAEQTAARTALEALEKSVLEHGDAVGRLNRAFHMSLIRPSGRRLSGSILERLHVMADRYVHKHLEPIGREDRANDEHREILDAWLKRDGATVGAHIEAHIERTLADLRQQLANGE